MSSTRKIRLSKQLTLRFQDSPMLIQETADENQQSQEDSHHLGFQNLPDLLPELFGSETDSPALNGRFSNRTFSTYQVWGSMSDLKSQNGATKSSFSESQACNGGTSDTVRSDDATDNKNKMYQGLEDVDDTFTSTLAFNIENLRHIVGAYPPRGCDIEEIEKHQLEFDSISITAEPSVQDNNWSMQLLDQLNDFPVEAESLEIECHNGSDNQDSLDNHALLKNPVTHKSTEPSGVIDDETISSKSSNSEEPHDVQQLYDEKLHRGQTKTIGRKQMVKDVGKIDLFSTAVDHPSSKFQRQKRSNFRRRRAAAGSSNQSGNDQKLRWFSMTGHSDTEHNVDGRHIAATTITGCRTKKLKRKKTASVAAMAKLASSMPKAVDAADLNPNILTV